MYILPSMCSQPEHDHALFEKTGIYINACQTSIEQPWNSLVFACHFGYIHLTLWEKRKTEVGKRECFFAKRFVFPEMHCFGWNTFFECPNFQLILLSGESLKLISSKVYVFKFVFLILLLFGWFQCQLFFHSMWISNRLHCF